jgi:Tol biopolymer transport system component
MRSQLHRLDAASGQFVPYLPEIGMADRTEFSKDGTHVAWIGANDGALWQSSLDGSQRLQLTSRPTEVFMMRWSPDGGKIAFMGREPARPGRSTPFRRTGVFRKRFWKIREAKRTPDWSPDGKAIIYGRTPEYMAEDSTPKAIQIVDLKTEMLYDMTSRQWTEIASGRFNNPVWSKDAPTSTFNP